MMSIMATQSDTNPGFAWRRAPWGRTLECRPLAAVAAHCFTGRDLGLAAHTGVTPEAWAALAGEIGVAPERLHRVRQVHGAEVACADDAVLSALDSPLAEADVLVAQRPGVALAVRVADCVPLLLADARTGAVAAAHAGWRGTAARVPVVAVRALVERYGARPRDLVAAIGPSIGECCYQVGPDVRERFAADGHHDRDLEAWFTADGDGRSRLDLWRACRDQLMGAGVPGAQIHVAGICTATDPRWSCSHRRDGERAGRMVAAIRPGRAA
jgi:hypothetical protein